MNTMRTCCPLTYFPHADTDLHWPAHSGRNQVVGLAMNNSIYNGQKFTTNLHYISVWLPIGPDVIHHNVSIDGYTAVLTIKKLNNTKSS